MATIRPSQAGLAVSCGSAAVSRIAGTVLRPGRRDDAEVCGRICFEAFREVATRHAFPPDFPQPAAAADLFVVMLAEPDVEVVVAERDGCILGSNALWALTPVAGVGPITVDPSAQDAAVGRALMAYVLERAAARGTIGVRLVQAAYHNRSLALYTKLGFDAREPLTVIQGSAVEARFPGRAVRPAEDRDLAACAELHLRLHGYSRAGELRGAIARRIATVVEHEGRISGYATEVGFLGHAVGAQTCDVAALIAGAGSFGGPGFLVPTRDSALLRWCLEQGLKVVQPMTLMTRGYYRQPEGAYLPSVLF